MSTAPVRPDYPEAPLFALDTLWFQVAGTLCNIQCAHCFISSSPTNRSHEMLSLETWRERRPLVKVAENLARLLSPLL